MTATAAAAAAEQSEGLSSAAAAAQLAQDGPNALRLDQPLRWRTIILGQLRETVIVVLLVAAVLTAAVGDLTDMSVILAVIVVNTALGASQEMRSGRALSALADLTAPHATVVRDWLAQDIPAAQVVRGDALILRAGDIVAADAVVRAVQALQVDESALTGESIPVAKSAGDDVFAGTVVTRGSGQAQVTRTGEHTVIGGIGQAIRTGSQGATPLQRQLAKLGRQLALLVALAAVAVGALNLATGRSVEISIVIALSLAVAAIPESLPAVVSLSLALAARRMAARGVLVRRLAAVEALGSVTVLASDKTGTLTEGHMRATGTWTGSDAPDTLDALLSAAVLCNDAAPDGGGERDDPTEIALVLAAAEFGIDVTTLRQQHPRIAETPFDALEARMITEHRAPDGAPYAICKGSPEALARMLDNPEVIAAATEDYVARGARVLAVASDHGPGWELLGVIALTDPPRPQARSTVKAFQDAGVTVVMITGDHPKTAEAIAASVGISSETGAGRPAVYARVKPEGKSSIVAALRSDGEIVAMTGDGVNDAPALRASDIGVAMGRRGTEVAKQAADLVLTEDDLSALVPAIAEGRRAWDNLRRFLYYALSGGIAEVLIMLFGPLFGYSLPLQAGQILWVNLLTHGLPGVAIGNEPAARDVLRRPPRNPREHLVNRAVAVRIGVLGTVIAGCSLLAGELRDTHWQTSIFVTLTLAQLGVAMASRPFANSAQRNPLLAGSVILNVGLVALAVWWSPLRELLHTTTLTGRDIAVCTAVAAPAWLVAFWQTHRRSRA